MIPIIVVGHAAGADLATHLAIRGGSLLAACVMLFPETKVSDLRRTMLDGLNVLVIVSDFKEESVAVGQHVCSVLGDLGASVICERVPPRRNLGPCETAIARVFISSLFGDDWPSPSARLSLPGDTL